jgi:uncharacterized protein YecE (DUF72 family)
MNIQNVYGGTSGLVLPEPNKSLFPEFYRDKSRLAYYSSLFNTIEINSSFKKLPMSRTVVKWAAEVPDNFQFTFKCWRGITHNKDLLFNTADISNFLQLINHVGNKKGCILIQFPGRLTIAYKPHLVQLLKTIHLFDPENQWRLALEFRNLSWYQSDIYDLLRENKVSLVLHDLPSSAPPMLVMAKFVYLRFHGTEKGYRGSYPDDFLRAYAERIKSWILEQKSVYFYFNNTLGNAAKNLQSLRRFLIELGCQ